ncbi:MAG: hypothetical protein QXP39_00630 [Candidatus Aenigmatarchaeota archaeon]
MSKNVLNEFNKKFYKILAKNLPFIPSNIYACDIGCGWMPYADAMMSVLDKKIKKLIAIDGDPESTYLRRWEKIKHTYNDKIEFKKKWIYGQNDLRSIADEFGIDKFGLVTLFAPGPNRNILMNYFYNGVKLDGEYILGPIEHALKPNMKKDGIVIVYTTEEDVPADEVEKRLVKSEFEILKNEEIYEFKNIFESVCIYNYKRIVIGRNR